MDNDPLYLFFGYFTNYLISISFGSVILFLILGLFLNNNYYYNKLFIIIDEIIISHYTDSLEKQKYLKENLNRYSLFGDLSDINMKSCVMAVISSILYSTFNGLFNFPLGNYWITALYSLLLFYLIWVIIFRKRYYDKIFDLIVKERNELFEAQKKYNELLQSNLSKYYFAYIKKTELIDDKLNAEYNIEDIDTIDDEIVDSLNEEQEKLDEKFLELLCEEGFSISQNELNLINKIHFENKLNEKFEKKILSNNAKYFEQYLNNYIKYYCNEHYEEIDKFIEFLAKRDIQFEKKVLAIELDKIIKTNSLKSFKNKLINDDVNIQSQIDSMTGIEFEEMLRKYYQEQGFYVNSTPKSNDYGADLVVEKFGEKFVIQAKRYSSNVGVKAIQEVVSAINYYKADKGIVVTNSYFTKNAIKLAKTNGIQLVERDELEKMLQCLK